MGASGQSENQRFHGKRAAVVLFSYYPSDPRPRRAAEALVSQGMCVELICLRQNKAERTREKFNGVNVWRIPFKRRRGGKVTYLVQYPLFILASFFLLTVRSLNRRYDLVHVHNMPDILVFSALVPKALGAKVVLDLHDPMPELMMTIFGLQRNCLGVRLLERLERWSIAFADAVFTVNLACKRIFASRSCLSEKVRVVMNSPDEEIFNFHPVTFAERDPSMPFVIMYHGSLVERHGLDIAVAACAAVKATIPSVELRVYGHPTAFLEQVMESVRQNSQSDFVRYFGARELEDIVAAIDECDLGIIPNRRSIFTEINTPTRIFEYLSRGKPVIAPRVPSIQDYFSEEEILFFDLGNANDLAGKIECAFHNRQAALRVAKRGQEVYLAHRWNAERQGMVDCVQKLLSVEKQSQ